MTTVFICMPYGDHNPPETRLRNTETAMDVWCEVSAWGFLAYLPHLSHFLHERTPRHREFWMHKSMNWLLKCDCVLAIGDPTKGMKREINLARAYGIPVFRTVESLVNAYGMREEELRQ